MVRTFQLTKALSRLTVHGEHAAGSARPDAASASSARCLRPLAGQEERHRARAERAAERFKLRAKKDDFAGTLSGGQRKLLEMARALMANPRWSCWTSRWPG